jgi:hypothetical protein
MQKNIQRYVHKTKNPLFSVLSGDLSMSSKFPKRIVNPFHFLHDQKHKKSTYPMAHSQTIVGFHLNFRLEANPHWGFLTIRANRRVATGTSTD